MVRGKEGDTKEVWMNPASVVTMRHLVDGRYVVYRVDRPGDQLVMNNLDEVKLVSEMFRQVVASQ